MKRLLAAAGFGILVAACSPAQPLVDATPAATPTAAVAPAPVAITVPAGQYAVDPAHASLTFKLQHLGLGYYAMKFGTYDATVAFDPANIAASSVTATINPTTIVTGYPLDYKAGHPNSTFTSWEDDLANSTNFLDAKQFPAITFASTAVEVSGERNAKVTGDLTLKGVTKPIVLDVVFTGEAASHPMAKAPAVGFSATGTFKRSDFGLDYLTGMIGDDVSVAIEGDFIQKPAT